jgi:hypothetical protein
VLDVAQELQELARLAVQLGGAGAAVAATSTRPGAVNGSPIAAEAAAATSIRPGPTSPRQELALEPHGVTGSAPGGGERGCRPARPVRAARCSPAERTRRGLR